MKILFCYLIALFCLFSCLDDDSDTADNPPMTNPEPKEYEIEFVGESSATEQYPLTITYYRDDSDGNLIPEIVNSMTNTDIIQSNTLTTYDQIGFSYETDEESQANVNIVVITDENDEIIFERTNLSIAIEDTFIYSVSDNSFTIN